MVAVSGTDWRVEPRAAIMSSSSPKVIGQGWPSTSELPALYAMPRSAADRAGKARTFEHTDVRVRAGARSATIASSANGFGDFCRNKSRPLAAASGTMRPCDRELDSGLRRNDGRDTGFPLARE